MVGAVGTLSVGDPEGGGQGAGWTWGVRGGRPAGEQSTGSGLGTRPSIIHVGTEINPVWLDGNMNWRWSSVKK